MTVTPTSALKGKTAIVTGAGRGIGRAIARRLSIVGADVVIASQTEEHLEQTRRMIERAGGSVLAVQTDVTKPNDVERLVEEVQERFGRIDVLVNNAGVAPVAPITDMEPHIFDRIIAVNVRAVYLCSRAVWPVMADGEGERSSTYPRWRRSTRSPALRPTARPRRSSTLTQRPWRRRAGRWAFESMRWRRGRWRRTCSARRFRTFLPRRRCNLTTWRRLSRTC